MQKLENRCDLLLIQYQKWMASVTGLLSLMEWALRIFMVITA